MEVIVKINKLFLLVLAIFCFSVIAHDEKHPGKAFRKSTARTKQASTRKHKKVKASNAAYLTLLDELNQDRLPEYKFWFCGIGLSLIAAYFCGPKIEPSPWYWPKHLTLNFIETCYELSPVVGLALIGGCVATVKT